MKSATPDGVDLVEGVGTCRGRTARVTAAGGGGAGLEGEPLMSSVR